MSDDQTRSLFGESPSPSPSRRDREGSPLPERLRPASLDQMLGLEKLIGPGGFLRNALEADRVPSMILWGPPGSGKTTIARIVASSTASRFVSLSAVTSGIKDVKAVLDDAHRMRERQGTRTIVFIDEIHRFNKAQQDAFLPYVEAGDIVLIGATTENPSFEVNSALLSRTRVVVLEPLQTNDLIALLRRGLEETKVAERGIELDDEALGFIAVTAGGDARRALNSLEMIAETATPRSVPLGVAEVREVLQQRALHYDKSGEEHYNLISALHKSIRNSEPDAAVYWLVRMLESGEEPMYLARRLVRMAAEDIGLADPRALEIAMSGTDATHFLGMPEAGVVLTEIAIYLALAPKSNAAYLAYGAAREQIRSGDAPPVPKHLRNAPTRLMKTLGYGRGYEYAHDNEGATTRMSSMPEELSGLKLYSPTSHGHEARIRERLAELEKLKNKLS